MSLLGTTCISVVNLEVAEGGVGQGGVGQGVWGRGCGAGRSFGCTRFIESCELAIHIVSGVQF